MSLEDVCKVIANLQDENTKLKQQIKELAKLVPQKVAHKALNIVMEIQEEVVESTPKVSEKKVKIKYNPITIDGDKYDNIWCIIRENIDYCETVYNFQIHKIVKDSNNKFTVPMKLINKNVLLLYGSQEEHPSYIISTLNNTDKFVNHDKVYDSDEYEFQSVVVNKDKHITNYYYKIPNDNLPKIQEIITEIFGNIQIYEGDEGRKKTQVFLMDSDSSAKIRPYLINRQFDISEL